MYAEGVNCLIGSDVKDWSRYSECSLPELKLEVQDFRQFLLLLRKTPEVLKTIMDRKTSELVEMKLHDDSSSITFPVYNDVNVVFGGKGTGKTSILEKIEEHFKTQGMTDISSYYASRNNDTYKQMVALKPVESDFAKLGVNDEGDNFEFLGGWHEPAVTPLDKYLTWEMHRAQKKDTEHFGFSVASAPDEPDLDAARDVVNQYCELVEDARGFMGNAVLAEALPSEDSVPLQALIEKACRCVQLYARETFTAAIALKLERFTIDKMKNYITVRTGNPTKPSSTGFSTFALNYKRARSALASIASAFETKPHEDEVLLGRLREKGDVVQHRKYLINPSHATKVVYLRAKVKANLLKSLVTAIEDASLFDRTPSAELSSKIAEINESLEDMGIASLKDCLGVASSVSCGSDLNYEPSNGERAMLVLAHALFDDNASIYILDEPEASMGNEFINDVIVDRINTLAKVGKVVVVSTHNANIAVRTLPWQSVYRAYEDGVYRTYVGNPFCDDLEDLAGKVPTLSWTQVSMSTLEGGEDAFTDRELVYGKLN